MKWTHLLNVKFAKPIISQRAEKRSLNSVVHTLGKLCQLTVMFATRD